MTAGLLRRLAQQIRRSIGTRRRQRVNPTCRFGRGTQIDQQTTFGRFVVVFDDVRLVGSTLGDYSYVQAGSFLVNAKLGKFCSVAGNVHVGLAAHPTHFVSTHPAFYDNTQALPKFFTKTKLTTEVMPETIIGNDVWIGQGALIKAGIRVGDGAVIGAGAVVTKDVSPYAVVAGVPAKLIKYRFDEALRARLTSTSWWDWTDEQLEHRASLFANPEEFLDRLEPKP